MSNLPTNLIRSSFELVAPRSAEVIDCFYTGLFAAAPGIRQMFPADLTSQKQHLLAAVGLVVKHSDNLDSLAQPLREMGLRHVAYGAKPEHYPVVRDVLVKSLSAVAGDGWTAAASEAWTEALNLVAGYMLEGAAGARQAA